MGPNRQARADVEAAVVRREDALLALEALQVQITNDIDTSLAMLQSSAENWQLWKEVHEREKKQLEAERRKFSGGRSDTREVLLREERVINSLLSVREQQLVHARAQVMLQSAQGTLMDRFR
jgi:outer membrane protein TolC